MAHRLQYCPGNELTGNLPEPKNEPQSHECRLPSGASSEILNRFGQFVRSGYAVMFDVPESQRLDLERKHIRLVELPPEGDLNTRLAEWLEQLR